MIRPSRTLALPLRIVVAWRAVLPVLVALILTACATPFRSEVARFHRLGEVGPDARFVIVPVDASREGSLEFGQYADLIRRELSSFGFRPADEADAADLKVGVEYAVSEGEPVVRSRPTVFYGFYGAYGHVHPFYTGYWYRGTFYGHYPFGYGPEVYSYTVYTRTLRMNIVRADSATREVLFEGEAVSVGRSHRLTEIMPYLVQAMFTNFPGESGVTKEVVIKRPDHSDRF